MGLLCDLLMSPAEGKVLERVIRATIQPVLENGEKLAYQFRSSTQMYEKVLDGVLEYCYRVGQLMTLISPLVVTVASKLIVRLWIREDDTEKK